MGAAGGGGETRATARVQKQPGAAAIAVIIAAAVAVAAAATAAAAATEQQLQPTAPPTPWPPPLLPKLKMEVVQPQESGGNDGFDGLIARLDYWAVITRHPMTKRNEGRRASGREGGLILEWRSASSYAGGRSRDVDVLLAQGASAFVRRKNITYPLALCSIQACILVDEIFR